VKLRHTMRIQRALLLMAILQDRGRENRWVPIGECART
jgi:hypothetical protein